jgi:hypothetical protein
MPINARRRGGNTEFYERTTGERVWTQAPIFFEEDSLGDAVAIADTRFTLKDVNSATEALLADGLTGTARLAMTNANESQLAGLTWNDNRSLTLNAGLVFETRLALHVLPTATGEAVWGLAGDYNAVADSVAESIWFKADGSGAIVVESDDTAITKDDQATGVTVTADLFAVYRIDCLDIADVKFYINGNRVAKAVTFDMSTVPTLALQPYVVIAKVNDTGVGTVDVDYIRIWQNRA